MMQEYNSKVRTCKMEELGCGSNHNVHCSFRTITCCHTSLHYLFNNTLLPLTFPRLLQPLINPPSAFAFSSQFCLMYNQKFKAPQTLATQLIKKNNNTLMAIF